jgi:hypothetical protein
MSVIEDRVQVSETLVTTGGGGAVTVIVAEPDLVESCVEVAVQVAVPTPLGVSTPPEVIVPPVALHITPVLKAPVPCTIAVHVAVCAVVIDAGTADTATEVMVVGTAFTTTEAEAVALPPAPVTVAVSVKVPVAVGMMVAP